MATKYICTVCGKESENLDAAIHEHVHRQISDSEMLRHLDLAIQNALLEQERMMDDLDAARERIAELEAIIAAILTAVKDDPSLQEQLVILYFAGPDSADETHLPFAKAIIRAEAAMAKAPEGD